MDRNSSLIPVLTHVVLGTAICILFGFIFFRSAVFRINFAPFQFVVTGIVGSTFYAMLKYKDARSSWLLHSLLLLIVLIVTRLNTPARIVGIALHFVVIGFSIILYQRYVVAPLINVKIGKFIAFTLIFLTFASVLLVIYGLVLRMPDIWIGLKVQSVLWIQVGVGLGLGLEIAELRYPVSAEMIEE